MQKVPCKNNQQTLHFIHLLQFYTVAPPCEGLGHQAPQHRAPLRPALGPLKPAPFLAARDSFVLFGQEVPYQSVGPANVVPR